MIVEELSIYGKPCAFFIEISGNNIFIENKMFLNTVPIKPLVQNNIWILVVH